MSLRLQFYRYAGPIRWQDCLPQKMGVRGSGCCLFLSKSVLTLRGTLDYIVTVSWHSKDPEVFDC